MLVAWRSPLPAQLAALLAATHECIAPAAAAPRAAPQSAHPPATSVEAAALDAASPSSPPQPAASRALPTPLYTVQCFSHALPPAVTDGAEETEGEAGEGEGREEGAESEEGEEGEGGEGGEGGAAPLWLPPLQLAEVWGGAAALYDGADLGEAARLCSAWGAAPSPGVAAPGVAAPGGASTQATQAAEAEGEATDDVLGESMGQDGTGTEADGDGSAAAAAAAAATEAAAAEGEELERWCPLGGGAAVLRLLLLRGAPAQLRRIASLDLTGVKLRGEAPLLGLLPVRMPRLRALWLRGITVDAALLATLGAGLPHLSLLSLGGCRGMNDAILLALLGSLPAATTFETRHVSPASPSAIVGRAYSSSGLHMETFHGPALTHLDLRACHELTDASLDAIAFYLSGLAELCAHGCRRLTDTGLAALSTSCPRLRWLNLSGAYKVTSAGSLCLLSSHPSLLVYNDPFAFGSEKHGGVVAPTTPAAAAASASG